MLFHTLSKSGSQPGLRYVDVARREIGGLVWETLTLRAHEQTIDDGHDRISMGRCVGGGTVHLAFDVHSEGQRYSVSRKWVIMDTGERNLLLKSVAFSEVLDPLAGCEGDEVVRELLGEKAYPKFLSLDTGELLFECRVAMAGKGSCVLFRFGPPQAVEEEGKARVLLWKWNFVGRYLVGEGCSLYINGLSWEPPPAEEGEGEGKGKIHVSWTNRHFVE